MLLSIRGVGSRLSSADSGKNHSLVHIEMTEEQGLGAEWTLEQLLLQGLVGCTLLLLGSVGRSVH